MKNIANSLGLIILLYWSYQLIFTNEHWIFLDYANLIIHETGHLITIFFPRIIMLLAGSLFQILVPCIALIYFIATHQKLASIFSIFWIGNNLINVSIYIKDAQTMYLPLAFGAGIHDWNAILAAGNLLKYDWLIGNFFFGIGIIFLAISISWLIIDSLQKLGKTN